MGDVGNFLLGGSKEKQSGQNTSTSTQNSSNQSNNSSVQASSNSSSNYNKSGSANYNQAYAPVSAAMTPTLGYTKQAGDMMGALLGLAPNTFSYNQTPYTPGPLLPSGGTPAASATPSLADLIKGVAKTLPHAAPAPTTATAAPAPTSSSASNSTGSSYNYKTADMEHREMGGPVSAGQPYVVGEKRPEVFVPHTDGHIEPSTAGFNPGAMGGRMNMMDLMGRMGGHQRPGLPTPGSPPIVAPGPVGGAHPVPPMSTVPTGPTASSALNQYANSAGLGFVLDQGQKALSGASAANGTFNSGATGTALVNYGQQLGNTYLDKYMQQLTNYGQLGLGGASALSNAGGVGQSQSAGGGSSTGTSAGVSTGSSSGTSTGNGTSQGTTSGNSNSKKGLVPDLLG